MAFQMTLYLVKVATLSLTSQTGPPNPFSSLRIPIVKNIIDHWSSGVRFRDSFKLKLPSSIMLGKRGPKKKIYV